VTDLHGGNILVPRSVLDTNMGGLTSRIWAILDSENQAAISGISVNASLHKGSHLPENAVNPAWRDAAISVVVVLYVRFSFPILSVSRNATHDLTEMCITDPLLTQTGHLTFSVNE